MNNKNNNNNKNTKNNDMLLTVGCSLLALWILGFVVFHVAGWLIHIFLVVAIIVILVRIIRGK